VVFSGCFSKEELALQIWRPAVNALNKQSQKVDVGCPSSFYSALDLDGSDLGDIKKEQIGRG
jgi:hypothetical protein